MSLTLKIIGTPAPQGSKSYKGRSKKGTAILVESSAGVRPWRDDVSRVAADAIAAGAPGTFPMDGPLELTAIFLLRCPPSYSKKQRAAGPITKPDLDKLIRSTQDALTTAGAIKDDSRIVALGGTRMVFAKDGTPTGAILRIRAFDVSLAPEVSL